MLSTYNRYQNGFIKSNLLIYLNDDLLNLEDEQDEIDTSGEIIDDLDFDSDLFINLETAGEKIRYISEYYKISDDALDKLRLIIDDLLNDSIKEDLENSLKAIIILLQYNFTFDFTDEMIKTIIESMFFEETAKNSIFIIVRI